MTKALIAGGGIAGPITAVGLIRSGIETMIYERYARTADGAGLYVTLAVNGIDALDALDLRHLVNEQGIVTATMRLANHDGTTLAEYPIGMPLANGTVTRSIMRRDLYVALRDEAIRQGARIEYGKELIDAVETMRGVSATFADGSTAEGDLLIGADGLHSRVRKIIDPEAPRPTYQPLLNTGGIAHGVTVDSPVGTMVMTFGSQCAVGYVKAPGDQVWWFANPPQPTEPNADDLRKLNHGFRERLLELVKRDNTPCAAVIAATADIMAPYGTYYLPTVPIWHSDRMVIVGDAAHATSPASGQGASMAIEDAVVLSQCLRDATGPNRVRDAFVAFERSRRARVEAIVKQGEAGGTGKFGGAEGQSFRKGLAEQVNTSQETSGCHPLAWMWEYHINWDAPVTAGPHC